MFFSAETLPATREWTQIFKILKERNDQPRIKYPAELSFTYEGEIKIFPDTQKLREFITRKPSLQEILKGVTQPKTKSKRSEHCKLTKKFTAEIGIICDKKDIKCEGQRFELAKGDGDQTH